MAGIALLFCFVVFIAIAFSSPGAFIFLIVVPIVLYFFNQETNSNEKDSEVPKSTVTPSSPSAAQTKNTDSSSISAVSHAGSSVYVTDFSRLRKDLKKYYEQELYNGFSMAQAELDRVQNASDDELIKIAQEELFDLSKYKVLSSSKPKSAPAAPSRSYTSAPSSRTYASSYSNTSPSTSTHYSTASSSYDRYSSSYNRYSSPSTHDRYSSPSSRDRYSSSSAHDRYSSPSAHDRYSSPSAHDRYSSYTPTINTDHLRKDMMDHYGTAMYSGFPMAQADLIHVQRASDAELIREAQRKGIDLNKYIY